MVFVVIDGLDASGKDTQAAGLRAFLRARGKSVFVRVHPSGDNFFGAEARHFLYCEGKSAHFASAVFYMFDVVRSILLYSWRRFDYVVFVRYLMGTAYLPSPLHKIGYRFFASVVPTSGFMFFLDVSPEEAYRRIRETRGKQEMFESLDELRLVRQRALSLLPMGDWVVVDGEKPMEKVEEEIRGLLKIRS